MKESEMQRPFFFFFSLRDHSFLRLRYYEGEFRPLFMFRKKVSCKQFIFKLKLSYQNKTYIRERLLFEMSNKKMCHYRDDIKGYCLLPIKDMPRKDYSLVYV